MSAMESTTLRHERVYFDSREAEAVERVMLCGSGGRISYSVFYFHFNPLEAMPGVGRGAVLAWPCVKGKKKITTGFIQTTSRLPGRIRQPD